MSLLREQRHYFFLIPLFAAFIWSSSLLAMLLTWLISRRPKYVSTQVAVVYISDIGASFLKPLFVVACCITGPGLLVSLAIERFLRHKGRLPPDLHTRERVLGQLAVVGAFIAMWGLALLSGFDVGQYPTLHAVFLLVFMVGVSLSALFTVLEFKWLSADYDDGYGGGDGRELTRLRRAYIAKAAIGLTLVGLAVVFGVTLFYAPNVGGVVEWLIAFGFALYLLTFVYDLRMAKGGKKQGMVEIP